MREALPTRESLADVGTLAARADDGNENYGKENLDCGYIFRISLMLQLRMEFVLL